MRDDLYMVTRQVPPDFFESDVPGVLCLYDTVWEKTQGSVRFEADNSYLLRNKELCRLAQEMDFGPFMEAE